MSSAPVSDSSALAARSVPAPRPMSGLERVWLVADRLHPPFVIQLVLECTGADPPGPDFTADLTTAVQAAAAALPGVRVRARGWLGRTRWCHDGPLPRVRQVSAPDWNGLSDANALFLADPLSAAGPVAEIVQVGSRLVFRALHAAMDGQGLLLFAQAVFTALRGQPIPPASDLRCCDTDLVAAAQARGQLPQVPWNPPPPRDARPVCALGQGPGSTWRRARVEGHTADPLPRLVAALGPGRIDVPVDLRQHQPDLRTTANLTGLVRIAVAAAPGSPPRVAARLRQAIDTGEHCNFVEQGRRVRALPLWLMAIAGRSSARNGQRTRHVTTSATVTNLGCLDHATLSGGAWTTGRAFVLPPGSPDLPALVTVTGDASGVEICVTCPTGGDPDIVLKRAVSALAISALAVSGLSARPPTP